MSLFPKAFLLILSEAAGIFLFLLRFLRKGAWPAGEWKELLKQCFNIGNKSLPLVGTTAFIIGLVLTMQSRPTLQLFGAESWLPAMVGISSVREIGPVLTALICAGKVGSSMGAELGSMKVTEQIDAMEVSAVNPMRYLVSTRVWACTFMLPLLVIFGDAIALTGSWIAVNINGIVTFDLFFKKVFANVAFGDFIPSILKSYFFGFIIGLIGCYKGYTAEKGTEGVGQAANSAVVIASLLVFVIDLLAVQISQILGFI
jgi:phospholipid/cholesterol/gamma-HCH transport system permease protein